MGNVKILSILLCALILGCGEDGDNGPMAPENRAPVIVAQPDTTVHVGGGLTLFAKAEDPDGDVISYRLTVFLTPAEIRTGRHPFVWFDGETGRMDYLASIGDVPGRKFAFWAEDPAGAADSTTFTVEVVSDSLVR